MNIWKKHFDAWCVLVDDAEAITACPGSVVTVTKRNGTTSQVALGARVTGNLFKVAGPTITSTATTPARVQVGEMNGLLQLFDRAAEHLRNPAIVLGVPAIGTTLRITRAGQSAAQPGTLNVLDNVLTNPRNGRRRWYGRVTRAGVFEMAAGANPAMTGRLQELARDPVRVASEHGRLTGNCCFCNRSLEDERSTSVGYGPVCAGHYGLPWGDRPVEFAATPEDDVQAFERLTR
jgi:hypothetical protein